MTTNSAKRQFRNQSIPDTLCDAKIYATQPVSMEEVVTVALKQLIQKNGEGQSLGKK